MRNFGWLVVVSVVVAGMGACGDDEGGSSSSGCETSSCPTFTCPGDPSPYQACLTNDACVESAADIAEFCGG